MVEVESTGEDCELPDFETELGGEEREECEGLKWLRISWNVQVLMNGSYSLIH